MTRPRAAAAPARRSCSCSRNSHALRLEAARDRQLRGHARQVAMEPGVEARHLRQRRQRVLRRLDQPDLDRQVIRVDRLDALEVGQQFRRQQRGIEVVHPVHDAMADADELVRIAALPQPLHQGRHRLGMVARTQRDRSGFAVDLEMRVAVSDPVQCSAADRRQLVIRAQQRAADAGGAAVQDEDAAGRRRHGKGRHRPMRQATHLWNFVRLSCSAVGHGTCRPGRWPHSHQDPCRAR
jgi:hypothetical protein